MGTGGLEFAQKCGGVILGLCLVTGTTAKDFLRAGGQLPNTTYALRSDRPRVAQQAADELLQHDPGHVGALSAKMLGAVEEKNVMQAREYARRVRQQAPDTSPPYNLAVKILTLDPNRPLGNKKVDEPKRADCRKLKL